MIKSLRPKEMQKVKKFFQETVSTDPEYLESVNKLDWKKVYELFQKRSFTGWSFEGCFWSTIYNIDNDVFNKLKFIPEGAFAYTDIDRIDLSDIESIGDNAFYNSNISYVTVSKKLHYIGNFSLNTTQSSIIHIKFDGTMKEFKAIKKSTSWYRDKYVNTHGCAYVICLDGDLEYGG